MYAMSTEKTAFVTWCLHGRLVQEINALTCNPLEPEEKYTLLIHAIVAHRSQHVQTLLQYPNIDVNLPDQVRFRRNAMDTKSMNEGMNE